MDNDILLGGGHRVCGQCGETTFGSVIHFCEHDKIKNANGIKPLLCDVALTNEDKDLFTEIMGRMLDIKEKPGTLCFCMEEILKHFDIKRKRDFA